MPAAAAELAAIRDAGWTDKSTMKDRGHWPDGSQFAMANLPMSKAVSCNVSPSTALQKTAPSLSKIDSRVTVIYICNIVYIKATYIRLVDKTNPGVDIFKVLADFCHYVN